MGGPKGQPVDPRVVAGVLRRARAVTAALGQAGPPYALERAAARCGVTKILRVDAPGAACRILEGDEGAPIIAVDRGLPPHTPEWNGCVAMTLARLLLPPAASGAGADELAEIAAAELLLPARAFRPQGSRPPVLRSHPADRAAVAPDRDVGRLRAAVARRGVGGSAPVAGRIAGNAVSAVPDVGRAGGSGVAGDRAPLRHASHRPAAPWGRRGAGAGRGGVVVHPVWPGPRGRRAGRARARRARSPGPRRGPRVRRESLPDLRISGAS